MSTKRTSIYLGRTEVPAAKSQVELQQLLIQAGARQIATDYAPNGSVIGMRFTLEHGKTSESYALPVRTVKLFEQLQSIRKSKSSAGIEQDRAQAQRVAWRQLLLWLKAQLALMDLGMTSAGEVFFAYQLASPTQTFYEAFEANGRKLLSAPK